MMRPETRTNICLLCKIVLKYWDLEDLEEKKAAPFSEIMLPLLQSVSIILDH